MTNKVTTYWKLHRLGLLLGLLSILCYYYFAHYLERAEFLKLIGLYGVLFLLCFKIIQFEKWNTRLLFGMGIVFRLLFWTTAPSLSQDFYRFIWDGQLIAHGYNPFLYMPNQAPTELLQLIPNAQELIAGMGDLSARNYSNYPPVNQFAFSLAAYLGGSSIIGQIVVLRVLLIGADIGIFYFGRKLLTLINVSPHMILWYYLNPLVIIELTGNLHFEGFMLLFFVMGLYFIFSKKVTPGAIFYGLSIGVKLIPLMFLPLFLNHFKLKRTLVFYSVVGVVLILCLLPFYSAEMAQNFGDTLSLWFSNFEFNAGVYNALKYLGLQIGEKPWEMVKSYGKLVPIIVLVVVFFTTLLRKNKEPRILMASMLLILTVYYLLSATVHPWYIVFLVVLCLGTEYRYPLFWSALVMLSYSAYRTVPTQEELGLVFLEYIVVIAVLIYEFFRINREKFFISKNSGQA